MTAPSNKVSAVVYDTFSITSACFKKHLRAVGRASNYSIPHPGSAVILHTTRLRYLNH